jgi:hypothetical protein
MLYENNKMKPQTQVSHPVHPQQPLKAVSKLKSKLHIPTADFGFSK